MELRSSWTIADSELRGYYLRLSEDERQYYHRVIDIIDVYDFNDLKTKIRKLRIDDIKQKQKMKIELPESNYLSAKGYPIGTKVKLEFLTEGTQEVSKKFGNDQYIFKVKVDDNDEKDWTPLIYQLKDLVERMGEDSKKWKTLCITLLVVQNTATKCGKSFQII